MFSYFNLPLQIVNIIHSNLSPRRIAAGVCLGMWLGFVPWNGPMALFLAVCLLVFNFNKTAAFLALPFFKAIYLLGVNKLADIVGTYLLIDLTFLNGFWRFVTHLPVIAWLDINYTCVAGGLAISLVLTAPVFWIARWCMRIYRNQYHEKVENTAFMKWFKTLTAVKTIADKTEQIKKKVS